MLTATPSRNSIRTPGSRHTPAIDWTAQYTAPVAEKRDRRRSRCADAEGGCGRYLAGSRYSSENSRIHHVDEVPVQGHSLDGIVVARRELPGQAAIQDDREHDRATEHVRPVEPGEREVGRAERARRQRDALIAEGDVVSRLQEQEYDADEERDRDVADERRPVAAADGPYGELARERRQDQQDVAGPTRGRTSRWNGSPVSTFTGGHAGAFGADVGVGREEAGEEHHLRGDEQQVPRTTLPIPPRASCASPATGLCSVVVRA